MCLVAISLHASKFPLVIAANRDEDYDRPTLPAAFWPDAPEILGGRDGLQGGTWLAVTRDGRFAAVTNLRGSEREPGKRSRGELVSEFVLGHTPAVQYLKDVAPRAHEYAGFHLLAGSADEVVLLSGSVMRLADGIHALSNAPAGERWPKVDEARAAIAGLATIDDAQEMVESVLQFLATRRGTGHVENEVFVAGERYGTRSSTAIVITPEHELFFAEQSYERGGVRDGETRRFRFTIGAP
ncbi:MAG TPA: NRDE family protein [Thermoanaerobaculia bacterium]